MNLKICFLAPSGYGKTTATKILSEIYNVKNIKIGTPLYELQTDFYKKLGMNIGDTQDGELLQFFGQKIRKEKPLYLLETFYSELNALNENYEIIINDDCRPSDYDYLKSLGFIFIKINGFSRDREDHTKANKKSALEWQSEIPYDYEINNYKGLLEYKNELINIVEVIKNDRKVLCYTSAKKVQF